MLKYVELESGLVKEHEVLAKSIVAKVLARFECKLSDNLLFTTFGTKDFKNNIQKFLPCFKFGYLNIFTCKLEFAVFSFRKSNGKTKYLSFEYNYESNEYINDKSFDQERAVDTSKYREELVDKNLNERIVNKILGTKIGKLNPTELLYSFDYPSGLYFFNTKNDDLDLLAKIIINKVKAKDKQDIVPVNELEIFRYAINLKSLEDLKISEIIFKIDNKAYELTLSKDINDCSINRVSLDDDYDIADNPITEAIKYKAIELFLKTFEYLAEEVEASRAMDAIRNYFNQIQNSANENKYVVFKEVVKIPSIKERYIEINDKLIVHTSRNPNEDKPIEIDIDKNVITKIKKAISDTKTEFIKSNSEEVLKFYEDSKLLLSDALTYDEAKNLANSLVNERLGDISPFDKRKTTFIENIAKVKAKQEELNNIDKVKISTVIGLMKNIHDEASFFEQAEKLYDEIDGLTDSEQLFIKNEISSFGEIYSCINNYNPNVNEVRKVYISKSVFKDITDIDAKNKELGLLDTLDKTVEALKTLPGNELGPYLVSKGLNYPINNDRSIRKIRIKRLEPYRIMFIYGADFLGKGNDNADSIYIFALTSHEFASDLAVAAKSKPTEYEINRFMIYPVNNKNIKIPETTEDQHNIAKNFEDRPIVTFGCAGSGKTTVSIEQYVNIYWYNHYVKEALLKEQEDKEKKERDLKHEQVYVTFHQKLCQNAKDFLKEYSVDGNCFVLYDYFADILGITLNKDKLLSETLFVDWFETEFIEGSNKYKKSTLIKDLKNKPDLARLIYTYYRGVFRGSKLLYETSNAQYLNHDQFLKEMSSESYLSYDEKEAIYKLCLVFYEYTKKEGIIGDNELAIDLINKINTVPEDKKYECIIIDEVQDLTAIEIVAIVLTLKKDCNRIYFYGDPHQSINPNLFDSSTINEVFTTLKRQGPKPNSDQLLYTYRTNKQLISYLQKLENIRRECIGATPGGVATIDAISEKDSETAWAGYIVPVSLYETALTITSSNTMIITPSEKVRRELLKKYPNADENRVITIYEAKGMEWDSVILYNIFSDYLTYFTDIVSQNGKAKRSTIHRMTFNKYYVACTRCVKSFVIVEENQSLYKETSNIFKNFISDFSSILDEASLNRFIAQDNTFDGWYKEALQNLNNENKSGLINALYHARKLAVTTEQKERLVTISNDNEDDLRRLAEQYMSEHKYDNASHIYVKLTKLDHKKYHKYRNVSTYLAGNPLNFPINIFKIIKDAEIIEKFPEVLPLLLKDEKFIKAFKNMRYTYKEMLKQIDERKN